MRKSMKRMGIGILTAGFILQGAAMDVSANEGGPHHDHSDKKIINVSHRGASGYAPEHTIPAYQLGEQLKGDYIEIDLQMTKDGQLIAMHDESVDRTTDGSGQVKELTLAEVKQLDAGSWFNEKYPQYAKIEYEGLKVPTLEEVLQKFGKQANYYIETKSPDVYPGMEAKLLDVLEDYKMIDKKGRTKNVLIQSFSQESLLTVHSLNANLPLVQLISYQSPAVITDEELETIAQYAIGVGPNFARIDEQYVQTVRNHDLQIHPYTVNTKEEMRRALDWGVTGLFTNFPDLFHEVIKEFKKR